MQTPAPINKLPLEILIVIFSMASQPCLKPSKVDFVLPTVLSSVCGLWRQVSLSTCSLWPHHLDLCWDSSRDVQYLRAGLWAERSQPAPLTVHIQESTGEKLDPDQADAHMLRLVTFLAPLMPRVSGLEITLQSPIQSLMDSLLLCWVNHGLVNSAKTLKITCYSESGTMLQLRDARAPSTREQALPRDFEVFFGSIHTLDLRNALAPWGSTMYQGLVELRLSWVSTYGWYPTQSQIAGVLAASPKLRSLVLTDLPMKSEPGFIPSPVTLNDLQVLSLESFGVTGLWLVFPLITGGSDTLSVSLTLEDSWSFVANALPFFARSNVTTLYARGSEYFETSIASLLGPIPHLRTLALKNCDFSDNDFRDFVDARATGTRTSDPCPQLQALYVLACSGNQQQIQQLVSIHPTIQTLRVVCDPASQVVWKTPQERIEFETTLSQSVPDVVCSHNVLDDDPTVYWDFISLRKCLKFR
jgi:hypothetical protein